MSEVPPDRAIALQTLADISRGRLAQYEADVQIWVESWKASNESGRDAIKACTVLNGGAAVAMLAFMGHLSSIPNKPNVLPQYASPLWWFVAGTVVSVLAGCFAYVSSRIVGRIFRLRQKYRADNDFEPVEGKKVARGWGWVSRLVNALAMLCVAAALVCFCYASWITYKAFLRTAVPVITSVR